MTTQVLRPRNRRVFESVFGSSNISLPTPYATPATNFIAPGQTWGGPPASILNEKLQTATQGHQSSRSSATNDHVEDQVKWDRAWHLVTHTLSLPQFRGEGIEPEELKPIPAQLDARFYTALKQVVRPDIQLPSARETENVVVWFSAQVRQDFLHQVLSILSRINAQYDGEELLGRSIKVLEMANRQYLHGLYLITQAIDDTPTTVSGLEITSDFKRDLNAVIGESVMGLLGSTVTTILRTKVTLALDFTSATSPERTLNFLEPDPKSTDRDDLLGLVHALYSVGLAGEKFQIIFAELMNDIMKEWIGLSYKGAWDTHSFWTGNLTVEQRSKIHAVLPRSANHIAPSYSVITLCAWVENLFAKLIVQVFGVLKIRGAVTLADLEKYKELAIGRLADLRIDELFDIVGGGPEVKGALDDLRTSITSPQKRLQLTENFARTLRERLLHPGTSTLRILQTYISMIRSFHKLDHSKVLLDRVAYPLQVYLFSREDTVRIIIEGLLSNTENQIGELDDPKNDKLYGLAHILKDEDSSKGSIDEELDWHDMEWTPDPVDAGPGYKRSKTADVIGTMIGVLGTQDVFIKEFQRIIGENLLRHEHQQGEPFRREVSSELMLKLQALLMTIADLSPRATENTVRGTSSTGMRSHAQRYV